MLKLLGEFILIKKLEEANKSVGGIYLTEESDDAVLRAEVVSFSEKVTGFDVGDEIIYPKQCYLMQMTVEGKKYFTIRPEEVVAVEKP